DDLERDPYDDRLEPRDRIGRRVAAEQRRRLELGVAGDQQRTLVREVAVGGGARDPGAPGGLLDRRCDALGEQLARRGNERGSRPRLLMRPPGGFIWD